MRAFAAIACVVTVFAALTATAVAQSQRFSDVPTDHYAFEAVEWAASVGVTTGYTDGTFKPAQPLSKRHAVVFMERYYDEILGAEQSEAFTRGDMMVLLKAINDGTIGDSETQQDSAANDAATQDREQDCHPAYTPCLPNRPGDAINCGDLTSEQKPVMVNEIGVDPYHLDRDRNGVGCTS